MLLFSNAPGRTAYSLEHVKHLKIITFANFEAGGGVGGGKQMGGIPKQRIYTEELIAKVWLLVGCISFGCQRQH